MQRTLKRKIVDSILKKYWTLFHPKEVEKGGFKFIIDPYVVPWYFEKKMGTRLLPVFEKYIKQGDIVLDVGASFGFYSVFSSRKAKKVFSFEPTTRAADLLKRNLELNHITNVELHQYGVGNVEQELFLEADPYCSGGNTILTSASSKTTKVKVMPIDKVVLHADFIKIDVEGMELQVLEGMKHLLKNSKPVILLEMNQNQREITNFLTEQGYEHIQKIGHNSVFEAKRK